MKFSIIVPIFNGSSTLKRCVDSVLAQKYDDWELLLIDDGSTDESAVLAEEFSVKDERISVIHQKNQGPFFAREAGLRAAVGEWVLFLDCDDYWKECCLQSIETAIAEQSPDCIFFLANKVDEEGNLLRKVGKWAEKQQWLDKERVYSLLLTSHEYNSLWTKAFRRELFDGDSTDYSTLLGSCCGEDKVRCLYPIHRAEHIFYMPKALCNYVLHPGSISAPSPEKVRIQMAEAMFRFCREYAKKWSLDSAMQSEMQAYYLRNFMSVYYNLRKNFGRSVLKSYPWRSMLCVDYKQNCWGSKLTLREKIKLFAALYLQW